MKQNARPIYIATWIGIVVNTLLAIMKGIGGILSGSKALLADSLHSASDIVGSIVVLFAVKIAHKPPDKEHPYGHGKAENVASIIVALLLIVVGIEISISSVKVFFGEQPAAPTTLALIIIFISIVIKEILFHYKYHLGKKYKSSALISEAWHHRSDALSSAAALVGVGSAILGEYYNLSFLLYGDALAGIVVSIIVIKVGYQLAKESSVVIMEKVLNEEDIKEYKETIQKVSGVLQIDQIYARTHGSYVIMDVKVSVHPEITVKKGHDIAKKIKNELIETHQDIENVFVHINPYQPK